VRIGDLVTLTKKNCYLIRRELGELGKEGPCLHFKFYRHICMAELTKTKEHTVGRNGLQV